MTTVNRNSPTTDPAYLELLMQQAAAQQKINSTNVVSNDVETKVDSFAAKPTVAPGSLGPAPVPLENAGPQSPDNGTAAADAMRNLADVLRKAATSDEAPHKTKTHHHHGGGGKAKPTDEDKDVDQDDPLDPNSRAYQAAAAATLEEAAQAMGTSIPAGRLPNEMLTKR